MNALASEAKLSELDSESCWNAVLQRDRSADGKFFYGVRSTGIYCRPSCPSRRPNLSQAQFFADTKAASAAGFRACKRCNPDGAARDAQLADQVSAYIHANIDLPISLKSLADETGVSPSHLQRVFKRATGISPREFAQNLRLKQFKTGLQMGEPVTSAIFDAGYGSTSRVYERSASHLGMTPSAYRKGGAGMRISYTIVDCQLGRLLVAATEKGVCAVTLGDDDTHLESELRKEYPRAELAAETHSCLAEWSKSVVAHLAGSSIPLNLPLDLQATAFQMRVWRHLQAIPLGQTRSYTDVAAEIGSPAATRAVARACATNPVAVVVPCHRVVRADGNLAGYRWGVERKKMLLEREKWESAK